MLPSNDRGRPGERAASNVINGDTNDTEDRRLFAYLTNFERSVLLDAWSQGRRIWWLKRAADFERAKPVPGPDATEEALARMRERWSWCHEVAQACRNKADAVTWEHVDEFDQLLEDCTRWAQDGAA